MNSSIKSLLILFVLATTALSGTSQNADFRDVTSMTLQNIGAFKKDGLVNGYFMFYELGKVDRKKRSYLLRLVDQNLKEIVKKKLVKSKYVSLKEAAFNGEALIFSFVDYRKKTRELVTYDKQMKKLGSRTYKMTKWEFQNFSKSRQVNQGAQNQTIHAFGEHGFVSYSVIKTKKMGYKLEYLPNDLNRTASWSEASLKKSKIVEVAGFTDADGECLLTTIFRKPKMMSNKRINFSLSLVDHKAKKERFSTELKDRKYN